ncbi:MAG: thioredoxin family protein [Actinomycetota bacterium]|nr:thioredoxin family protein [Actinomycetota bacterium]
MIKELKNKTHLDNVINKNKDCKIIIFYSNSSEKSKKALEKLKEIKKENPDAPIFSVNASEVRDIHPIYGINMVPAVLVLKDSKASNIIYGIHDKNYFERLLYDNHTFKISGKDAGKHHRVIVYTSPTCSWCGAVKSYLIKNHIPFREIDISRDTKAGEELIRRSGQSSIPQTDIDGRIVVGFDKAKLDSILGIKNN